MLILVGSAHAQQSALDTAASLTRNPAIYALLVAQHNNVKYEKYCNGKNANDLFNSQSLTKDVMSLLVGIAINKGYIKSIDEPLSRFFPSLLQDKDKRKQRVTIREIMNQASGLWHEDLESLGGVKAYLDLPNPSQQVLTAEMASNPADSFHYSNAVTHLLSVIITNTSGLSTRDFAQKYLFDPLGIQTYNWPEMKDGYYDGSGLLGLEMHTRDVYKIGQLVLQDGKYNGKQVVPEAWIQQLKQPTRTYATAWGFEGSRYALCWYHVKYENLELQYGLGWGGQLLILIPSLDAVVVVHQDHTTPTAPRQTYRFIYGVLPMVLKLLQ